MGMLTYLQQERDRHAKRASQVKDFSVFDFNYIPDEPIMREECKHLISEMVQFETGGIPNLPESLLFILRAVATCKSDFAKEIYEKYRKVSSGQQERPFSYVHYYANLSYLQSMGLVPLIATKVGCTYANRVMLTFDESVFDPIYSLRFSGGQNL